MAWHSLEERSRSITALPCSSRSCSIRFQSLAAMRSVMLFTGVKISAIAFMFGLLLAMIASHSDSNDCFSPLALQLLLSKFNCQLPLPLDSNNHRVIEDERD